jgi:hypothetical protein
MEEIKKYNLAEAAKILGLSEIALWRKVKNREITFCQPKKRSHIYFKPEHLAEYEERITFRAQAA